MKLNILKSLREPVSPEAKEMPKPLLPAISKWVRERVANLGKSSDMRKYPAEDIDMWKSGSKKFQEFWKKVSEDDKNIINLNGLGALQAMFLGEKAMTQTHNIQISKKTKNLLEEIGYRFNKTNIYDPILVSKIMKKYPEIFDKFGSSVDEVINSILNENQYTSADRHLAIGLLFGFPIQAVKKFSQESKDEINHTDRVGNIVIKLQDILPEPDRNYMFKNFNPNLRHNPPDRKVRKSEVINFFRKNIYKYRSQLGIAEDDIEGILASFRKEIERKGIDIYGINWVGYNTPEENMHEKRLIDAFRISGITKNTVNNSRKVLHKHVYADERD